MQLKSLEMQGFKSFADRTEFKFDPGVTGIVGPNGCGKSNVVDAMKWVLGDLSAKSIRGDDMLDCIFNGSGNRAPSGFAEVSLTFDNADGKLATEFSEVTISRRLYRSGESEYLINRQPSRRKDILDLFMDTGVGTDAYSIIEQGRITVVLEASPKDRRALIDEAAGISRYRARKKESLSRLERVDNDLLRLGDTLKELESQVRSLRIQAGKAQRYVQLRDELRDKKTRLALVAFDSLRAQAREVEERLEVTQARRAGIEAALAQVEEDARRAAVAEEEARAAWAAAHGRREAAGRDVDACGKSIEDAESLARHMESEARQAATALEERRAEVAALSAREAEARAALEVAETELAALARGIEESERAVAHAVEESRRIERDRAEKQREAMEAMHKRAQYRNDGAGVEAQRRGLEAQRVRAAEKAERLKREAADLDGRIGGILAEKSTIDGEVGRLKGENAEAETGLLAARAASTEAGRALSERREAFAKTSSRLETFRDLERQMEGVGAGAKKLIEASRKGAVPGFRGLVADLLEFDPATALAAEAILGDRAQAAVFDSVETMRAGLALAGGRVAMISLDRFRASRIIQSALSLEALGAEFLPQAAPGTPAGWLANADALDADFYGPTFGWEPVPEADDDFFAQFQVPTGPELVAQIFPEKPPTGRLSEFVRCAPEHVALALALCGNARIVASREEALALLADGLLDGPAATLEGDVVFPDGLVMAGGARAGLIRRRAEARALAADVVKIQGEVEDLGKQRAACAAAEAEFEARCRALRAAIYDRSHDSVEKKAEAEAVERRLQVLRSEMDVTDREDADAREQEARLAERAAKISQVLADLDDLEARLKEEGQALAARAAGAAAACESVRRALEELRVSRAEAQGRRDAGSAAVAESARQIRVAESAASQAQSRIAECDQRHASALDAVQERRARLEGLRTALEDAARDAVAAESAREEAVAAARDASTRKAGAEGELRSVHQELSGLQLEQSTLKVKEDSHVARFAEELGINLREACETLPRGEAVDEETLSKEVLELHRRIDNMGGVNPEAINELKEREERFAYLTTQQQDLVNTKAQLEDLIRKINRESRELLIATLEQTRINFNEIFRKLFGGGKAEIVQEEGEDVLDCGIDILAKPPGKEPATISQLSGGEKTLTTLAFIMALFMLKPSPFCILDEVDAPLDEANVDRYNRLIKDFAQGTQFIVITHNKKTMAAVDALYGVTMQERGVSRKVSVRVVDEAKPEAAAAADVAVVEAGAVTA